MATALLVIQGGVNGYVAGLAFGTGIEFWIAIIINAMLVVAYGNSLSR